MSTRESDDPAKGVTEQRSARDPLGLDDAPDEVSGGAFGSEAAQAPPPRGGGGRGLAAFALVLALVAAAGAGYLYYELIHRGDARMGDRLGALEARVETQLTALERRLDARLSAIDERQRSSLEAFAEGQRADRQAAAAALEAALAEVADRAPPTSGEWREAEVGYLLRIANQRLLMERDVAGALQLLRAADAILAEIDDFALHPVRARLADEITALQGVRELDLPGVFLRLESAKRELAGLPLQVPRYHAPASTAPAQPPASAEPPATGVLAELKRQFAGLLRVRRLESDAQALLAPEESVFLELNLRLMLERAQLAAMNRETLVFQESLADAGDWVRRYFDAGDPAVRRLLDELAALQTLVLDQPLPDVSGSLNALEQVRRTPLPDAPR